MATDYSVDEEIQKLIGFCEKLSGGVGGTFTFKDLFYAPGCGGAFESLVGTLIAAKKKGIVTYDSPMGKTGLLLQGAHDNVVITYNGLQK
ncbi:SAM domain (Sterile alpha motif) domain containing protein [Balamuthia mandrillaris]